VTAGARTLVRRVLEILPVVRANEGIRVEELSRLTGIPVKEIVSELPRLVNLCGVPPYSPMDLLDLEIEGDRVTVRFAEQFRRPVRLTLGEALALDMALAGWEEEAEGPFAAAVTSIREKVRAALSPDVAESLSRASDAISVPSGPGRAAGMVARLKNALSRQTAVRVEYFSMSSGRLSERRVEPYGLFEQDGRFYVVAFTAPPGRVITLRADRVRALADTGEEYDVPADFDVMAWLNEGPPAPETPAMTAVIRFGPEHGRFARELFPSRDLEEDEDGTVTARVRTSGRYWLVFELLRWGAKAEVLEPAELRTTLVDRARETLARYGARGP
jgi:proteasome accessory factor C